MVKIRQTRLDQKIAQMDQPKIGQDLSSLFQKHKYKINFQLRMKKKKI